MRRHAMVLLAAALVASCAQAGPDANRAASASGPQVAGQPAGGAPTGAAKRPEHDSMTRAGDQRGRDPAGGPPHTPAQSDDALEHPAATTPSAATGLEAVKRFRSVRRHPRVAAPTRIRIPAIGVSSDLESLGRKPDGTVEVPSAWQQAGWYADGPRPGQPGSAVVLGHVDSREGPAVFFRVRDLEPGDAVLVDRRDGTTARFLVDRVEGHPKDSFPTDAVYFPTLEPALRLVTCGGEFDGTVGHYRDNVIAFATLAD